MHRGYVTLGGTELINHDRLFSYFAAGIRPPGDFTVLDEDRWKWLGKWLGVPAYRSPRMDPAPWIDGAPAADEFIGLHLRSYTGIDDVPWTRDAVESITDGGSHGLGRYGTRRIELKLTAYGTSHAGLHHGLSWLNDVLMRPVCDDRDATVSMRYLTAVPMVAADIDNPAAGMLAECVAPHRRVLHDVATTSGPTIDRWWIPDVSGVTGEHMAADLTVVLTAGDPHPYSDAATALVGPLTWAAAPTQAVTWRTAYHGICDDGSPATTLTDPGSVVRTVPRRATTAPNRICLPLYYRTTTATIPAVVAAGEPTLTISVAAGATAVLRNVVIRVRDLTTDRVVGEIGVSYLPAGARVTIDGVTGRAVAILTDGTTLDASPVVSAGSLGPLTSVLLSCRRSYRVEATAPDDVPADASVTVLGTTRWVS